MADQRLRQFHATYFPAFVREGTRRKKMWKEVGRKNDRLGAHKLCHFVRGNRGERERGESNPAYPLCWRTKLAFRFRAHVSSGVIKDIPMMRGNSMKSLKYCPSEHLHAMFPFWVYFLNTQSHSLYNLALCLLPLWKDALRQIKVDRNDFILLWLFTGAAQDIVRPFTCLLCFPELEQSIRE